MRVARSLPQLAVIIFFGKVTVCLHVHERYNCFMNIKLEKDSSLAFDDDAMRVKVYKALADPTRLQIVRYLNRIKRGVTCGEISRVVQMSPSSGSYHFKTLHEAGLTIDERHSREKYVSLNEETFRKYAPGFLASL